MMFDSMVFIFLESLKDFMGGFPPNFTIGLISLPLIYNS